tara:strand:+ start:439 stop:615 length:177 start_codon:yes stop_codon:yes gene_type:complete
MIYYTSADLALDAAKEFLIANSRSHALIYQNRIGFMVIDPRDKRGHYSMIVGKLYRKA